MEAYQSGSGVVTGQMADEYYAKLRPEMAALLPVQARKILDVGCGAGRFAHSLKTADREVWGIEIHRDQGARAAKLLDRVLIGDVCGLLQELPDQYFDAIYFNDVLEHLVDPYSLLRQIQGKLRPQGVILVSLPNVRYIRNLFHLLIKKDWAYVDHGVLDRTHLRFFTLKSARDTFREVGLEVEAWQGIESSKKWYLPLLNAICFGYFSDTFHLQYIFRLRPKHGSNSI